MNTFQSFFSIGALFILSLIVLRVNNSILFSDTVLYDSKYGILANSIATSIVEKATRKFFDENTVLGPVPSGNLTNPNFFGPDDDETPPDECNDFDDFHGYTQKDTLYGSVVFYSDCSVVYVDPSNPDGKVPGNSRSWHKKLTVKTYWKNVGVNEPIPTDTFKVSTIYSYWYFQ
jgi:hypothetical protein